MPAAPVNLAGLRALLAGRFPEKARRSDHGVPTGVPAVDDALGGGLPAGRLTELVSAAPSSGGQTVLARLLVATRAARVRVALVDGADGFAPEAVPADALRHLVWVRGRDLADAMAAADLLVRDGNYAVLVLDLRGCAARPAAPSRRRAGTGCSGRRKEDGGGARPDAVPARAGGAMAARPAPAGHPGGRPGRAGPARGAACG